MTETRTPSFIFQANRIRQNENLRSNRDTHGRWQPPRALHGSQIRRGQSTDRYFYFNGERTAEIDRLPDGVELYRTVSMYYSLGQFYMVPFDCTRYSVGSGRANDEEGDSSEEEDAEGEEEGELEIYSIDWSLLRFHWKRQGYLSEAWFNGSYPRLNTQRSNQRWVNKLLPSPYRAEFSRRTEDPLYGGLNGDLAILIALLAFSAYDGAVADVFQSTVRAVHGSNGGWRMHNRHEEEGWVDKRGFVVHVWSYPPYSTSEQLHGLERGTCGKIWP